MKRPKHSKAEKDDPVLQDNVGNSTVEDYMIKKMIIVIITL
jgi:hypothetical protein